MAETKPSPAGKLESPSDVKKKQALVLAVAVIGVLMAAFFTTLFTEGGSEVIAPRKKDVVSKSQVAAPGSNVDARDVWIGTAGNQIATLERDKKQLEDRIKRLEESSERKSTASSGYGLPPMGVPPMPQVPPLPQTPPNAPVAQPPVGNSPPAVGTGQPVVPGAGGARGARPVVGDGLPTAPPSIVTTPVSAVSEPAAADGAAGPTRAAGAATPPKSDAAAAAAAAVAPAPAPGPVPAAARSAGGADKDLTREDYLPAGSFFRAVLISGLDAPTGGQVQANPHPVLLRLVDNAVLPNLFRAQVKECFIVAAGYGDMSSERAYMRTESMSCVNHKGQVVDVAINGWAIGDDGKAGIRGRVVSKQGQALANAIMSGVLSGIGSAIRESSVNTQIGGGFMGGVVQTPKPGEEFRAGMGEGISKGLDRLTDYYVKLAEKMFPVIEVDAGRVVDVALSKGMSMKGLFKNEPTTAHNVDGYPALKGRQGLLQNMSRAPEKL
jgi:conjugal transfer pilus assembly protein TraB